MTGIDPEGFDLRAGERLARADFAAPLRDARAARAALVEMTRTARKLSVNFQGL
jgi:putative heme iron utilization protein